MKHRRGLLRAIAMLLAVSLVMSNEAAFCGVAYAAGTSDTSYAEVSSTTDSSTNVWGG